MVNNHHCREVKPAESSAKSKTDCILLRVSLHNRIQPVFNFAQDSTSFTSPQWLSSSRVGATVFFLCEWKASLLSQKHTFWSCMYPRKLMNATKTKFGWVLKIAYFLRLRILLCLVYVLTVGVSVMSNLQHTCVLSVILILFERAQIFSAHE